MNITKRNKLLSFCSVSIAQPSAPQKALLKYYQTSFIQPLIKVSFLIISANAPKIFKDDEMFVSKT